MVRKIDELNQTIQQYEDQSHTLVEEKKELNDKLERNKNAGAKLELSNTKLE